MEKVTIFLQKVPNDIEEFIKQYLDKLDDNLKNNPAFKEAVTKSLDYLTRKWDSSVNIPPLELTVYDDGKGFEIGGGVRRDPDNGNPQLQNNKHHSRVKVSINENNVMEVTEYGGTFYRFDDYVNINENNQEEFRGMNAHSTPVVLKVFHAHKTIMPNGMEIEGSRYSDAYPLSCAFEDERELVAETVIHSPSNWNYNVMPDRPRYEWRPYIFKAHRWINSPGLVTIQTSYGRDGKVDAAEYPAGTEYPDKLTTGPTPYLEYKNGEPVISESYHRDYPDMNRWDLEVMLMKTFYQSIDYSRSNQISDRREICESIKELTKEGLINRFHVEENEIEEGRKRG